MGAAFLKFYDHFLIARATFPLNIKEIFFFIENIWVPRTVFYTNKRQSVLNLYFTKKKIKRRKNATKINFL